MAYNRLWVLVEGNDDQRFLEKIKPAIGEGYDSIESWQYAQEPAKRTKNFLKAIRAMNSDYFFLVDINDSPCIIAKKQNIKNEYGKTINVQNVIIVVKEIESWYLAGLDDQGCRNLSVQTFRSTDNITKEQFNTLMPKKFDSRIDFMAEILKRFSVETAKQKNASFSYFMQKI